MLRTVLISLTYTESVVQILSSRWEQIAKTYSHFSGSLWLMLEGLSGRGTTGAIFGLITYVAT